MKHPSNPPIRVFVSYSHLDREWFGKLRPLLKFKVPTCAVYMWHDQELKAGDCWDDEIRKELQRMHVFLCLVSYYWLASDYIEKVETKEALRREKEGEIVFVPLLICDMDERDIKHFKRFNPLPAWGRSWRSYEKDGGHTMDAHKPIRTGLWQAIEKVSNMRTAHLVST